MVENHQILSGLMDQAAIGLAKGITKGPSLQTVIQAGTGLAIFTGLGERGDQKRVKSQYFQARFL
jgi:hypothetical protein